MQDIPITSIFKPNFLPWPANRTQNTEYNPPYILSTIFPLYSKDAHARNPCFLPLGFCHRGCLEIFLFLRLKSQAPYQYHPTQKSPHTSQPFSVPFLTTPLFWILYFSACYQYCPQWEHICHAHHCTLQAQNQAQPLKQSMG